MKGEEMLSFVDALKRIIADIETTGGAVIERTLPSHQLLQQLREYAIQGSSQSPNGYYVGDWFFEGYFEEHVRLCVVYCHKLGISDDNHVYHLLTKVLDKVVNGHAGISEDQE